MFYVFVEVDRVIHIRFARTEDEASVIAASLFDTFKSTPHQRAA